MAEEREEMTLRDVPAGGADLGALLGGLLGGEGGLSGGDLGAGIGAVLQDPQMMAKLPEVIAMLRPMMGQMSGVRSDAEVPRPEEVADVAAASKPKAAEHGAGPQDGGSRCRERRIALLCALRPYLSPRRQEAIDYILRMDKMGKLFRNG